MPASRRFASAEREATILRTAPTSADNSVTNTVDESGCMTLAFSASESIRFAASMVSRRSSVAR